MQRRIPVGWLVVTFVATLAAFMTSTAVSAYVVRNVHERAANISERSLPAIEALTSLRSSIFRAELLLHRDRDALDGERTAVRAELAETVDDLEREERAATTLLNGFSGQRELARLAREVALATDGLRQAARSDLPIDAATAEHVELALQTARTDALALVDQSVEGAAADAAHIASSNRRFMGLAFVLDGLSALLALVLGVLAWNALRGHLRIREAQERLLDERAAELEAFAGRVAHDILNPLSAVGLNLHILQERLPGEPRVLRAADSLGRAHGLVVALLGFARAGSQPEPGASCAVRKVVAGVVADQADVAAARGIEITVQADDVRAACTDGVLASIVGNLLANAIKYMDSSKVRQIEIAARGHAGRVQVDVRDTGPGISPGMLRTIFQPYVRGKNHREPGIGLGLATVKKLCEAHGGRIEVESALGTGSCFRFELPEAAATELDHGAPRPQVH